MERKHAKADVGVIIGRFQVDKLHAGHYELLLWVCNEHRKVIVVLGVPDVPGLRENPLDFESRAQMIQQAAADHKLSLSVVPLSDTRTNKEWSDNLDRLVQSLVGPQQTITLYGARDSFLRCYTGRFQTQELVGSQEHWNGTEIRNAIRQAVRPTEDFRAGVIWSSFDHHKRVVTTVDIALFRDNTVLFARKPGQDGYRFIGGFADPSCQTFEEDAAREVREETGLEASNIRYLGSCLIDDWRYRGCDKIRTVFFRADASAGFAECKDPGEAFDAFYWIDLAVLRTMSVDLVVPEHRKLFELLRSSI